MFEMMDYVDGVGFVVFQIGLFICVVVINLDVFFEDYFEYKDFCKVYINVYIDVVEGEEVFMEEGCFSLLGIYEFVKRGSKIYVRYMDENFVEYNEVVEGFLVWVM